MRLMDAATPVVIEREPQHHRVTVPAAQPGRPVGDGRDNLLARWWERPATGQVLGEDLAADPRWRPPDDSECLEDEGHRPDQPGHVGRPPGFAHEPGAHVVELDERADDTRRRPAS